VIRLWGKSEGVGCFIRLITGIVFCVSNNADSIMESTSRVIKVKELRGFPDKEIGKSEFLYIVCAMGSFENIKEET
jgi:hypothetical protein